MPHTLRYFIIDGENILWLPLERLRKICGGVEAVPEYRSQSVKCIQLVVRKEKQHYVSIAQVQGLIYHFDADGYYDFQFTREQQKLKLNVCDQAKCRKADEKVYDASVMFANKRFEATFTWEPELELVKRIKEQFLGM